MESEVSSPAAPETRTRSQDSALQPKLGRVTTLFLVAAALFCRTLGISHGPWRLLAAGLACLTIPLGVGWSATAQLAGLVGVLIAALIAEHVRARRGPSAAQ